jgi:hypothetical protein
MVSFDSVIGGLEQPEYPVFPCFIGAGFVGDLLMDKDDKSSYSKS